MKVELKNAKVELEVGEGKAFIHINGHRVQVTREVGVTLIFGQEKPGLKKTAPKKRGCQSFESKKKLSASLKAYHAKKKHSKPKKPTKSLIKAAPPTVKKGAAKPTGKSHLNGASSMSMN